MLDGSYVSYDDYMERKEDLSSKVNDLFGDASEVSSEDLPF